MITTAQMNNSQCDDYKHGRAERENTCFVNPSTTDDA